MYYRCCGFGGELGDIVVNDDCLAAALLRHLAALAVHGTAAGAFCVGRRKICHACHQRSG